MLKSIILTISCSLLVMLLGMNYHLINKKNHELANQLAKVQALQKENEVYKNDYVAFSILTFKYQDCGVLKDVVLISESGENVSFATICAKSEHVIVFHFNELNCNVCVENELSKIRRIIAADPFLSNKLIVIGKYSQQRYLSIFKRINKFAFEIYNIRGDDLSAFGTNLPFYFVLDRDFTYKSFFIPNKNSPDVTPAYFAMMKKNYFNTKP